MEGREGKKNEKIKVWELKSEKKNEFTKETFKERHRTGRLPKKIFDHCFDPFMGLAFQWAFFFY